VNGVPERVHEFGSVEVNGQCEPAGEGGRDKSDGFQGHDVKRNDLRLNDS
jgi:hypothetical protein